MCYYVRRFFLTFRLGQRERTCKYKQLLCYSIRRFVWAGGEINHGYCWVQTLSFEWQNEICTALYSHSKGYFLRGYWSTILNDVFQDIPCHCKWTQRWNVKTRAPDSVLYHIPSPLLHRLEPKVLKDYKYDSTQSYKITRKYMPFLTRSERERYTENISYR